MGLFDLFLSRDERIRRQQRQLTNRDKVAEDRDAAARWLADDGSPKALVALLTRFDMKLDNHLKDQAERDMVYGLLSDIGEPVLRPLERHLVKCRNTSAPIRLHAELTDLETTRGKVFEVLEVERQKDDFRPEKKQDLLTWLADHKDDRAIDAVGPLLQDFDENVRYAAAEVVLAQDDERGQAILEPALANPQEESNRLRVRLAEAFSKRRWKLHNAEGVAAVLPDGFVVDGDEVVRR